jgi:DNA-binding MarR family transcriptional regulator
MPRAPSQPQLSADPEGEFPRDPTTYIFHLFAVISRHREARIDQILQPMGLNVSRHRALSVVASLAPCTMSELADYSAVDRTTMTRTVDQLVEAGLVERATPREDRRQVVLTLTEAGLQTCEASRGAIFQLGLELLDGLPAVQQRAVARCFEAILANLLADDPRLLHRLLLRDAERAGRQPS